MNAIGITLTLLSAVMVLFAPRRWAVLGVFVSVCYITQGQGVEVGGFHFFAQRIVLLAGLIRIVTRGELRSLKLNKIDWALLAYAVVSTIMPIIRMGSGKNKWAGSITSCYPISFLGASSPVGRMFRI